MKTLTISQALERYMNSPELIDKEKAWIGCDLDGTLAKYDSWKGWDHIGDPIPNMVTRIKNYMARGITVKIWTARASKVSLARNDLEFSQMEKVIQDWTEKHLGKRLEVVTEKDCWMIGAIDDSVMQVEPNTGNIIGSEILADVGDDTDFEHPIKDYTQGDLNGLMEWNQVDLDPVQVYFNDFSMGLVKGGFATTEDVDSPGSQICIKATSDSNISMFNLNTCTGHLHNEADTVWLCVDTNVVNGSERMLFKLDNLSFRSLGKWYAERILKKA